MPRCVVLLAATILLAGCTKETTVNEPVQPPGEPGGARALICPEAKPLTDTEGWSKGRGKFRAWRAEGDVVVWAEGMTPTPGHEVKLALSEPGAQPPKLTLYWKGPDGPVAQVLTEYTTCARLPDGKDIPTVLVEDADGVTEVSVEQVR